LVDVPLCVGATGSLFAFYGMAERARGGSLFSVARKLPAVIALGAGLAPHLTGAVLDGLRSMSGEFVRTPKRGEVKGRYRQASKLPLAELALGLVSATSVVAAYMTGHYIAMPFALLFTLGYGYVAALVMLEQLGRSAPARAPDAAAAAEALPDVFSGLGPRGQTGQTQTQTANAA
jgi:hypothetical protein